jgi:hypothetical protein
MRPSFTIITAMALLGAGCNKTPQQSADREMSGVAFVRVVNATEGPPLDIFAGDRKAFTEVKPGWAIPYREIPRGITTFRARFTGQEKEPPVAENVEMLGHREYSTILLLPAPDGKVEMTIFDDHEWAPSTGKAKVRLVHTIPAMSDIDIYSQGKKLLGGIDYKDESRYVEMDPSAGDIELKRADNQKSVATVSNLKLAANQAYTILLVGIKEKPRTIVLEDRVKEKPRIPPPLTGS